MEKFEIMEELQAHLGKTGYWKKEVIKNIYMGDIHIVFELATYLYPKTGRKVYGITTKIYCHDDFFDSYIPEVFHSDIYHSFGDCSRYIASFEKYGLSMPIMQNVSCWGWF